MKPGTPADGDYARHVEQILGAPGARSADKRLGPERLLSHPGESIAGWLISVAVTLTFGSLGFLALSERAITVGTKKGNPHFEGGAAVAVGFVFLGVALLPAIKLATNTRFFSAYRNERAVALAGVDRHLFRVLLLTGRVAM